MRRAEAHGQELLEANALLVLQAFANRASADLAANGIDQDAHVYATLASSYQRIGNARAGDVANEEVAHEKDVALRRVNGLHHGRVGLIPIVQKRDAIVSEQRPACHASGKLQKDQHRLFHVGIRVTQFGDRAFVAFQHATAGEQPARLPFTGAGLDAIHSKGPIEEGADEGQQQAREQPAKLRSWIALEQECMACRTHCQSRSKSQTSDK